MTWFLTTAPGRCIMVAVTAVLGLISLLVAADRNGARRARANQLEEVADAQNRMAEAAADAPPDRDGVVDRLRRGEF